MLMIYSLWLFYVMALLLPDILQKHDNGKYVPCVGNVAAVLVFLILAHNVKLANGVYLKKDIERQSTLSYMTRVVSFMDSFEEFDPQKNEVLFIGEPAVEPSETYSPVDFITGAGLAGMITDKDVFQVYFDYILQYPIKAVKNEDRDAILSQIAAEELDVFPGLNCCAWVGDTLVVRLQ